MHTIKFYSPSERLEHVRACSLWRRKGNTFISYCRAHGIARSTMEYWIKKYGQSGTENSEVQTRSFVKVAGRSYEEHPPVHNCSLTVNVGPLTIELPAGNSNADLKRVLLTLKEII